jgi:hypothetical protein
MLHQLRALKVIAAAIICCPLSCSPVVGQEIDGVIYPQNVQVHRPGWGLLTQQRWKEAGDAYGVLYSQIAIDVEAAWKASANKSDAETSAYRCRLLSFYFRHMDFSDVGWAGPWRWLESLATEYPEVVKRLRAVDGVEVVDFSHVELMKRTEQLSREHKLSVQDKAPILAALKANPDSIPAVVAYIMYLKRERPGANLRSDADPDWTEARALLKGSFAKLTLARSAASCSSGPTDQLLAAILRDSWDLAPSDAQKAQLLCSLAERLKSTEGRAAMETATMVYERFPSSLDAGRARMLAASFLITHEGPDAAMTLVRQLQRQGEAQSAGLDRVLFDVATAYFQKGKHDQCEAILLELVRDHAKQSTASRAMLALAQLHRKKGNEAKEIEWLKRCAEFELTEPTAMHIMDTDNTSSQAIQLLAIWHEKKGDWKEALRWWQTWKPSSWCGTCHEQMVARKNSHIELCERQIHFQSLQLEPPGSEASWVRRVLRSPWTSGAVAGTSCVFTVFVLWFLYVRNPRTRSAAIIHSPDH